jgi:hypothetical protein
VLKVRSVVVISLIGLFLIVFVACSGKPTESTVVYSVPELKYILLSNFDDIFYVDPDYYPVAREGQEQQNAQEQFSNIRADTAEFSAILEHLDLPNKSEYTDEEKLLIYREHKKLTLAVEISASDSMYNFALRVKEGQGESIEGTISPSGVIKITKREPSFNTYPICLAKGTQIDTPEGSIPVEQLHEGMKVWTVDKTGKRVEGVVIETTLTKIISSFKLVKIQLSDGRSVTASPGHPTAECKPIGSYNLGDTLDGALVISVNYINYIGYATYDFLPTGSTGLYWANGILLRSTLVSNN